MIKISLIPNILNKNDRVSITVPFKRNLTIKDYIKLSKWKVDGWKVIVSGRRITNLDQPIENEDEIIFTPDVELEAIGAFLYWAFVTHWFTTLVVIATIASTVVSLMMAQGVRTPNFGTLGEGIDESSPTYGWDGIQTVHEVGVPVPIVYGEHKIGGNIINEYVSTDGDKNYLNVLLSLCEGEIESISDIKINDQPIANFSGITYETKYGTNAQTTIPNFEDLHETYSVAVALNALNSNHIYTSTGIDIEGFDVLLTLPNGLFQTDAGSGSIGSWAVTYKVEYKLHSGESYIDLGSFTISDKSRTVLRRTFSKRGLTPGQYDIRVTRTSAASSLDPVQTGDLTWTSVDEITCDDLAYPNAALLGIRALASEQLSGAIPNFSAIVKGRKINIPDVHYGGVAIDWEDYYWDTTGLIFRRLSDDAACTWDGVTYIDAYCANPIWCLKDLLTSSRFGVGEFIASTNISAAQFLDMAKYCETRVSDGNGGYEKRFRLDIVIDGSSRALDAILQICATFRAFPFYSNDGISVVIDKAGTPVQLFGMGNIIKDSFQQSWKSVKEVPNVIEVQFLDKDLDYAQETVVVIDEVALAAGDPMRKKQIKVFTTRKSYALREGKFALLNCKYINRSVIFRAGIDAIACQAGDIISIAHDVPQWGFSGRVQASSTTTKVKLDQTVVIEAGKSYQVMVRFADDTIEIKSVTDAAGSYTEVTVGSAFTQAPAVADIYSFGEVNKVKKDFRVLGIKRENNGEVEIIALEYDSNIYDTDTITLPTNNYSSLTLTVPNVTSLLLTEGSAVLPDGTIKSSIEAWFQRPDDTTSQNKYLFAKIFISDDGGSSYQFAGQTYGSSFSISGDFVKTQTYHVKVVTVCTNDIQGKLSDAPSSSIVIAGRVTPPAAVTGFAYSWGSDLELSWGTGTSPDLAGYEIRDEDANFGDDDIHLIYKGLANKKVLIPASRAPGTYYIRAFNTSGIYSASSASVTPTNAVPAVPSGLAADIFFNIARLYWTDLTATDILHYEVYVSKTNAWGGEESLLAKISGRNCTVQGEASLNGSATDNGVDNTDYITDVDLAGFGTDYWLGSYVEIVSGTGVGQEKKITGYNTTTGRFTVASAWTTKPDTTSKFFVHSVRYYKVRGVDKYGEGSFTSALEVKFVEFTESMLSDQAITGRKLYASDIITLSAQIKDAIITSAKILSLDGSKITANSITVSKLASDAVPPKTFYQNDAPTTGMNTGDYWVDTNDSNKLYIYQSSAWVEVSSGGGAGGGITVFRQTSI
ncbi:MAG: phage tail protein, partial [Dehalococcoidales bacterium]|nr:phage tail protein [Dehalococcoidales bacterium]